VMPQMHRTVRALGDVGITTVISRLSR
jgi:hypothetical protein